MELQPFKLERFFAKHEFTAPYLACCSDCEPLTMAELLAIADEDSLHRWDSLWLGYTETQGLPVLREAVAEAYFNHIKADDIIILAPEEGIYLTMRALLNSGDHVIVTYPGYQSLYEIARSMGCKIDRWEPRFKPDGAIQWDVEDLKALFTEKTRMVVINFPHNPTGTTLSQEAFNTVIQLVKNHGSYLLSDEMYRLLELDTSHRLPCAADCISTAISLGGCSKALALPGLRLGWIACKDTAFRDKVLQLKDYTTICSSAPSEVLALAAVRASDRIVQRNLQLVKDNIKAFQSLVNDFPDLLTWKPPAASSVAFPRLINCNDIEGWCDQLVAEKGVLLLPATVYDHNPSSEAAHFRIGLGRRNLPECLELLRQHLKALQQT